MNINLTLLGRASIDQPFAELSSSSVALVGKRIAWTPTIPFEAVGHELQVQVASPEQVTVDVGVWLDDATRPSRSDSIEDKGPILGREPPPAPWVKAQFGVFRGRPRDIPLPASPGASLVIKRSVADH